MVSVQGVQGPSVVSHVPASLESICWALTLHTKPTSRNNRNTYPFILALLSRGVSITTGTEAYMRWYNDCLSRVPGDWYAQFCGEGVIAISSPYPTSYKSCTTRRAGSLMKAPGGGPLTWRKGLKALQPPCGHCVCVITSPCPCHMLGDNADTSIGMGVIGRIQVVVCCECVPPLYLCTPERQSLCESHRRRRWLTCWS